MSKVLPEAPPAGAPPRPVALRRPGAHGPDQAVAEERPGVRRPRSGGRVDPLGAVAAIALGAFAAFCVVSSGTYFVNDAVDADTDRTTRPSGYRPVAAGIVSRRLAVVVGAALMAARGRGRHGDRLAPGLVLAIYIGVQLGYTLLPQASADLRPGAIAGGFVLRAIAGGVAVPVAGPEWFLIVATFGSLLDGHGQASGGARRAR